MARRHQKPHQEFQLPQTHVKLRTDEFFAPVIVWQDKLLQGYPLSWMKAPITTIELLDILQQASCHRIHYFLGHGLGIGTTLTYCTILCLVAVLCEHLGAALQLVGDRQALMQGHEPVQCILTFPVGGKRGGGHASFPWQAVKFEEQYAHKEVHESFNLPLNATAEYTTLSANWWKSFFKLSRLFDQRQGQTL
jgi:hypothetical protein